MRYRALFLLYYLRALPVVDFRHVVAVALARADVRLYQLRRQRLSSGGRS